MYCAGKLAQQQETASRRHAEVQENTEAQRELLYQNFILK